MEPADDGGRTTGAASPDQARTIKARVLALRDAALALEGIGEDEIALVHPERRLAARNLVDYLALRQHDLRDLQRALYDQGLTTLGVVHRHVMGSMDAVLVVLDRLCGENGAPGRSDGHPPLSSRGETLEAFADDALGPPSQPGLIRVMVTMPSEAADDPALIASLLSQGMTIMRVNCAHDGPDAWKRMVDHLRSGSTELGLPCRIAFDLAGPKLRTGPIADGPEVLRFKPIRDYSGRVLTPAAIQFEPSDTTHRPDSLVIPLDPGLCREAVAGDELRLRDARGRRRTLQVVSTSEGGLVEASSDRTIYLTSGASVELRRGGDVIGIGQIGRLPALPGEIVLSAGDSLVVTRELTPGHRATTGADGAVAAPATIGCSLPEVFEHVEAGHRVLLDDGKFEGVVREVDAAWFRVEIVRAGRGQARLLAEKGMNFPDTTLNLPALTEKDIRDLQFVAAHGDLVSLSFVHDPGDIDELYTQLGGLGAVDLGVILKIENRTAFEGLPELLMTASKRKRIAVMLARGDLGVEIGFERLAEVQEELLWLCEAAQVPVIWATQVLESLAKDGLPTRGEVTDAAMSIRAECVMLNKGPYIDQALCFLCDVARRMKQHSDKTFTTHRALNVAASGWLEVDRSESGVGLARAR